MLEIGRYRLRFVAGLDQAALAAIEKTVVMKKSPFAGKSPAELKGEAPPPAGRLLPRPRGRPRLNGRPINDKPCPLDHHDLIQLDPVKLPFCQR